MAQWRANQHQVENAVVRIVNLPIYYTETNVETLLPYMSGPSLNVKTVYMGYDKQKNLKFAYIIFNSLTEASSIVSCFDSYWLEGYKLQIDLITRDMKYKIYSEGLQKNVPLVKQINKCFKQFCYTKPTGVNDNKSIPNKNNHVSPLNLGSNLAAATSSENQVSDTRAQASIAVLNTRLNATSQYNSPNIHSNWLVPQNNNNNVTQATPRDTLRNLKTIQQSITNSSWDSRGKISEDNRNKKHLALVANRLRTLKVAEKRAQQKFDNLTAQRLSEPSSVKFENITENKQKPVDSTLSSSASRKNVCEIQISNMSAQRINSTQYPTQTVTRPSLTLSKNSIQTLTLEKKLELGKYIVMPPVASPGRPILNESPTVARFGSLILDSKVKPFTSQRKTIQQSITNNSWDSRGKISEDNRNKRDLASVANRLGTLEVAEKRAQQKFDNLTSQRLSEPSSVKFENITENKQKPADSTLSSSANRKNVCEIQISNMSAQRISSTQYPNQTVTRPSPTPSKNSIQSLTLQKKLELGKCTVMPSVASPGRSILNESPAVARSGSLTLDNKVKPSTSQRLQPTVVSKTISKTAGSNAETELLQNITSNSNCAVPGNEIAASKNVARSVTSYKRVAEDISENKKTPETVVRSFDEIGEEAVHVPEAKPAKVNCSLQ